MTSPSFSKDVPADHDDQHTCKHMIQCCLSVERDCELDDEAYRDGFTAGLIAAALLLLVFYGLNALINTADGPDDSELIMQREAVSQIALGPDAPFEMNLSTPPCPTGYMDLYGTCQVASVNYYGSYIPSAHQAFLDQWGFMYYTDGNIGQFFSGGEILHYDEETMRFWTTIGYDDEFYFNDIYGQPIDRSFGGVCYSSTTPRVYGSDPSIAAVHMTCDEMK